MRGRTPMIGALCRRWMLTVACMAARFVTGIAACLAGSMTASSAAWAQGYPTKPIRMVVTAAAGGITDIIARIMADQMQKSMGQPIVVDNKPGAGGNIGTEFVVKSPPDGYTLVIVNVGTVSVHRWVYEKMPFDPINDLVPVAPVVDGASIAAVNSKLPINNLKELVDYARQNPGKVNYGSAGIATMPHLCGEVFAFMTGTQLTHVPYKGANPAAVDLGAGQIQAAFIALGSMRAQVAAGQVRMIAVGAKERLAAIPSIPTFEEAGLLGYDVTNWFGVFAPKGTPRDIVQALNTNIARMFDDPTVLKRVQDGGMVPMRESPEAFARRVLADDAKWRDVVRRAGIKQ